MSKPSATANFRALAYDAQGRLIGEQKAQWSLDGLEATWAGTQITAPVQTRGQAGLVKAAIGGVTGAARVRIVPVPDYTDDFNRYGDNAVPPHWISAAAGRYKVITHEGEKVLFKEPNETLFRRMRVFFGPNDLHDYTVEVDMMAPERRRQLGDGGIFAQRYGLVLFAVYLVIYGGFVLLNAFRPDLADERVLAGLNLAIVYGMALIFAAFGLAVVYGWLCRAPAHAPSNATGVGGEERR